MASAVAWTLGWSILAVGADARTQSSPNPVVLRFAGTYRNPLPDGGRSIILDAIEPVVGRMAAVRGNIARRRLIENDPPIPRITIAPNGDGLIVDYTHGRRNVTVRLGEYADNPTASGGRVDVKHEIVGGRIRETYRERRGGGVNILELSPDGNRLVFDATITSRHLPSDIVYRLTFDRVR